MVTSPAIWYIAVKKFDATAGEHWLAYRRWRQLPHLQEVILLDNILCPSVIEEFTAEDWRHNVQEDYLISFFTDVEYLFSRLADPGTANVLAVLRERTLEALSQSGRYKRKNDYHRSYSVEP